MTMPLKRDTYDVWVCREDGEPVMDGADPDHTVTVTTGDQMRGELELRKHGMPPMSEAPLNATAAFIWCALARLGLTERVFPEWLAFELAEYSPNRERVTVDPTTAVPSATA